MGSAGRIAMTGAVLFGCSGELAPEDTPKVDFDGSDARSNADASLAVGAVDAALDAFSTPPDVGAPMVSVDAGCTGGATTSVSGKVYDPSGNNPISNATVYIPAGLPAIPIGTATCDP